MSTLSNLLNAVQPKLVVTAPDGQRLFVDLAPGPDDGSAPTSSLWPNGFKVSLALKLPDANVDQNFTTSPTDFFVSQSPTLLTAPGPADISWGAWLFALTLLSVLPFVLVYLKKK